MSLMFCRKPVIHILSILLLFSCNSSAQREKTAIPVKADSAQAGIEDREKASAIQDARIEDTLGHKIFTVSFKVKATKKEDLETFEDGIIPWIDLDSPKRTIKHLVDPDEIVIPYQKVALMIDYPLARPVFFELSSPSKGFTRKQIVLAISKKYHEIYDEEERTAATKTIPMAQRKTLANRNETDGKYGIWGHDLSDLMLDTIDVYKNDKGEVFLQLSIES